MIIESKITIDRPAKAVWRALTDRRGWKHWYGQPLQKVDPRWEKGATLIFQTGSGRSLHLRSSSGSASVVDFLPTRRLYFYDHMRREAFNLEAAGESTRVTYELSDTTPLVRFEPPAPFEVECEAMLARLKQRVERRSRHSLRFWSR